MEIILKSRIGSMRHKEWDYAAEGYYFVTICAKGKKDYFGKIKEDKMMMNGFGKIAEKFWKEIPEHFDFVNLDEFVIMPNHIHGILVTRSIDDNVSGARHCLARNYPANGTGKACLTPTDGTNGRKFQNQGKGTLSSIVGSYKSACTKAIRAYKDDFAWQDNFYDRIIRTEKELGNIRRYVIENPLLWDKDEYFHR